MLLYQEEEEFRSEHLVRVHGNHLGIIIWVFGIIEMNKTMKNSFLRLPK